MDNNKYVQDDNVVTPIEEEEESSFDWRSIYMMFVLNWKWFLLSIIVFLSGAYLYLRYTDPVFQVSAKMLIKEEEGRRGSRNAIASAQNLGLVSSSNGIDNEVQIAQSRILAEDAVRALKLYVEYKRDGRIKDHLIYKTQPVDVDLDPKSLEIMKEKPFPITMQITKQGRTYKVEGNAYHIVKYVEGNSVEAVPFSSTIKSLPATISTVAGTLTFTRNVNEEADQLPEGGILYATINSPAAVAARFAGATTVEATDKMSSIMRITLHDYNKSRAIDYVKQLIISYNQQANADKNEIAKKTEEFINGRLEKINSELGLTEGQLESFKRSNNLTNLEADATEALSQTTRYSSELSDARTQIQLIDYLRQYVDNPKNKYQVIPSTVGMKDQSSTSLITKYNEAVLDRNRLLRSASELSPQVITLTATLDDLQSSIRTALLQARHSADIQLQSTESQYATYQSRKSSAPQQERVLTQIGRQQEVRSGLYLLLLQKREENSISLASTADKGKLIDVPSYEGKVSPKDSMILLVALVLAIGLPMGILYLKQLMRFRIEGHDDVVKLTKLPIIADVAVANEKAKNAAGIVVHENKNNQIDEIFRAMRTNIQFMLKEGQKVVMFTSSTSGEGKTFNAANLSVSFALLGKRVLLMGLDIRKPALGRLFGKSDLKLGITQLLTNVELTDELIKKQIQPSDVNPNLDLMLAGPIPPNPTELLARPNFKKVVDSLREMYDYIIFDTAPVGIVTDTLELAKYADVTAFVVRADYTQKSSLPMINILAKEGKLPSPCVIINGVDLSKKKYSYAYGYGRYGKYKRYGHYGYGGYGSYTSYGHYSNSRYSDKDDDSIKK